MARIILFGGGDGGGIRITRNGIEPIPPWDPTIRYQLRALNALVRAGRMMTKRDNAKSLDAIIGKLTGVVLTQIEAVVGEVDAENGLVFQDEDGGFTCGSTGKPPIPFPWPVDPRKTVEGLISNGIVDAPTVTFLRQATERKIDVFDAARDPQGTAKRIGVALSPEVERGLQNFNLEKNDPQDRVDQEVIGFYRKVVQDGRFISDWVVDPARVAERLKMKVSEKAIERIVATRDFGFRNPGGDFMSPYAVAVTVAIVIVLWSKEVELPVLDRSGRNKF